MAQMANETFDAFGSPGNPFGGPDVTKGDAVLSEVGSLYNTAKTLETSMDFAIKAKSPYMVGKLHGLARQALVKLGGFMKKAIELAAYKMVIELCAMIMDSIMSTINKKLNQKMDISTSSIRYVGGESTTSPGFGSDPFATSSSPFGNSNSSAFGWR